MKTNTMPNRWFVVAGAILIQLALGALYAWSVFTRLLTDPAGLYQFTATQTAWIFSAGLATFAAVMILAGRWLARTGPRTMTILGGLLLGLGFILGGFFGTSFWAQFICIGLLAGAGIGLGYVVPIAVGVKWFPDKKGMITGLAVAGFGFGATIWVKLAGSWFGGLLNYAEVFGLPPVQSVFVIYGFIFAALVLLGSIVMVNPPDGYQPRGWKPADAEAASSLGGTGFEPAQMLKTSQFYSIWVVFLSSAIAGLMVIYCIKLFGIDALEFHGVENAGITTETAVAWLAIFNGLGRILWGMISDRIGRKTAIIIMSALQGVAMLMTYHVFIFTGQTTGLVIAACLIGFNYGGIFALFPAITADWFGNKEVGRNYGWVFSAYGVAGIVGPLLAGIFKDAAAGGSSPIGWMTPFLIAGISCLIGALIMMATRRPGRSKISSPGRLATDNA
ncbi:MAG: OFA family MFS transporter [Xanthomonadales bacterium]|nr:OFA family MFS transporter [Gammaproteobacteria bacterium]MBT8055330.1 OFA family MFS transporter [Gammaproteobacteria bacterium]NNL05497.1 OFA family MFS transporter [Xanthomonadales bacterium]